MIKQIMDKVLFLLKDNKGRINYYRKQGIQIGEHCEIYKSVIFGSEPYLIELGNFVRITDGVKFITHDGGMWVIRNLGYELLADKFGAIVVGNNVHIGMDSIIMPGVKIGNNVVVGCGSVVTKDIPDNSIAAGIPARVIEKVEEYYLKNKDKIVLTKEMGNQEKRIYLLGQRRRGGVN